jgi:hypothetical protein
MKATDEQEHVAEINKLHQELQELAVGALDRAIRLGELLSAAKSRVPHGQWLPWLTNNVAFSERTVRNYMRIFENRVAVKSANVSDLGEAYQILMLQSQVAGKTGDALMTKTEAKRLDRAIIKGLKKILELKIQLIELHWTSRESLDPSSELGATFELFAKRPSEEELRRHLFCPNPEADGIP